MIDDIVARHGQIADDDLAKVGQPGGGEDGGEVEHGDHSLTAAGKPTRVKRAGFAGSAY